MKITKDIIEELIKNLYTGDEVVIHTVWKDCNECKEVCDDFDQEEEEPQVNKFKIGQPVYVIWVYCVEYTRVRSMWYDDVNGEWNYQVEWVLMPVAESELVEVSEEELDKYYV